MAHFSGDSSGEKCSALGAAVSVWEVPPCYSTGKPQPTAWKRLRRWRKLIAEDRFNSASLAERRLKDRAFGKMVRKTMKDSKARR